MQSSQQAGDGSTAKDKVQVSQGSLDELLDEIPDEAQAYQRGRLEGLRDGKRHIYIVTAAACAIVGLSSTLYIVWQHRIESARFDIPFTHPQVESSQAQMHWSEGKARLGLHEDGIREIVLPDRVLTLAQGCKHAQVWVEVKAGKTVALRKILGEIEQNPRK